MALSGSGGETYGSLPGGQTYSVLRGGTFSARFSGQADMTHLWFTQGISASPPVNFIGLTSSIGLAQIWGTDSFSAKAGSDGTYSGSFTNDNPPMKSGWTAGSHLWAMFWDQPLLPSNTDVPASVVDLGVIVA